MMTVIDANILPIIISLLVGLLIGWWIFRGRAETPAAPIEKKRSEPISQLVIPPQPKAATPYRDRRPIRDGIDTHEARHEGRGLADSGAAATADVTGELLGLKAHAELPGADAPPDNLQVLKGVGPKLALKLNENGITRFEQLARLSDNEVAILENKLGPFKGRLSRDRVVEQATYLARDDRDGFEARFGSLGSA